ncbi:hypothetical protein [Flavobacterium sp. AJR]|uniref:hypothetical protein n=1 Tax=Flavobacterium sp. AJR TaxID=1979369 RepID=UPI000A3D781E|nr:hypothetical protein [Flavobacterium sp. AJR]OUL62747.1 hypothetical protein B8T70_08475 [Flavobacterium sp. AJR]
MKNTFLIYKDGIDDYKIDMNPNEVEKILKQKNEFREYEKYTNGSRFTLSSTKEFGYYFYFKNDKLKTIILNDATNIEIDKTKYTIGNEDEKNLFLSKHNPYIVNRDLIFTDLNMMISGLLSPYEIIQIAVYSENKKKKEEKEIVSGRTYNNIYGPGKKLALNSVLKPGVSLDFLKFGMTKKEIKELIGKLPLQEEKKYQVWEDFKLTFGKKNKLKKIKLNSATTIDIYVEETKIYSSKDKKLIYPNDFTEVKSPYTKKGIFKNRKAFYNKDLRVLFEPNDVFIYPIEIHR